MLTPGTQIDRYELVSPIGEGGMAEVWVARQQGKHGFAKLFALKAIHSRFADEPQFRAMFLDEARIASAIEHPNVAQVFDLGEAESLLYLVMEYVDGESLASILTAIGKTSGKSAVVPTGIALRIIADTCAGLHAAHRLTDEKGHLRGVVHRDVSPQNILLATKGDVKVIDFGIALAKDRLGGDTADGRLKGKLHYMAPEQARREPVGAYTDVFAAGATLYRMLAGWPVYQSDSEAGTLALLLSGVAPTPLPEDVPPLVAAIVDRALSHDPGDRYSSALGMQTAIEAAIVEEGFVPDVATWVNANVSDRYRTRREQLAQRAARATSEPVSSGITSAPVSPADVPDLHLPEARSGPPPKRAEAAPRAGRPRAVPGEIVSFSAGLTEPEPEPEHDAPSDVERSFMDVRAIAAQRATPLAAPGKAPLGQSPKSDEAAVQASEPPPKRSQPPPKRETATETRVASRSGGWIKLAVAVIVVILLACGGLLLLPMIARDRIIATAREAGVELAFDGIGVGFSGVSLRGVTARIPSIPGVEVKADEIYASGLSASKVRLSGLELKIDGTVPDVGARLVRFYVSDHPRIAGTEGEPRHISIVGARLSWERPFGDGTRIDASDVGAELDSKGSDELHASVGRFEVRTKKTVLGPWSASFEQAQGSSRARLLLDPALPDGPSVLYVFGPEVVTKLTIRVARSPLAHLGIRPDDLGLPADPATELEAKIEAGVGPSQRIEAKAKVDLWGARVKLWKAPTDVHFDGAFSGLPGKSLELDHTTASVGPFTAQVTGTITPADDGVRLDAAWRTQPVSCAALAKAEAKTMGAFVATLQDLAHQTGAARVTGTAHATGIVQYDTRSPDEASFTITAKESCGLSLFGL